MPSGLQREKEFFAMMMMPALARNRLSPCDWRDVIKDFHGSTADI